MIRCDLQGSGFIQQNICHDALGFVVGMLHVCGDVHLHAFVSKAETRLEPQALGEHTKEVY